jgi:hypothetical protein
MAVSQQRQPQILDFENSLNLLPVSLRTLSVPCIAPRLYPDSLTFSSWRPSRNHGLSSSFGPALASFRQAAALGFNQHWDRLWLLHSVHQSPY